MFKPLIVIILLLMNSIIYAVNNGFYLGVAGGYGSLRGKLSQEETMILPLSKKGFIGSSLHYQYSTPLAVTINFLPFFSSTLAEKLYLRAGMVELLGKFNLMSLDTIKFNVYGQGGGWYGLSGSRFTDPTLKDKTWVPLHGYGVVAGIGINREIAPKLLLDISFSGLISLSQMNHSGILKISGTYDFFSRRPKVEVPAIALDPSLLPDED